MSINAQGCQANAACNTEPQPQPQRAGCCRRVVVRVRGSRIGYRRSKGRTDSRQGPQTVGRIDLKSQPRPQPQREGLCLAGTDRVKRHPQGRGKRVRRGVADCIATVQPNDDLRRRGQSHTKTQSLNCWRRTGRMYHRTVRVDLQGSRRRHSPAETSQRSPLAARGK